MRTFSATATGESRPCSDHRQPVVPTVDCTAVLCSSCLWNLWTGSCACESRGKHVIRELSEFLRQEGEERRGTLDMSKEQQADIQAFCEHVPNIELQAEIVVDDEAEIVVGDVATCRITMTRKNLKVRDLQCNCFCKRRFFRNRILRSLEEPMCRKRAVMHVRSVADCVAVVSGRRSCRGSACTVFPRTEVRRMVDIFEGKGRQCYWR